MILINDGSTDKSLQIAQGFSDERIRVIDNHHDFIQTLNIGLEQAVGKYVIRMDADDKMHKDRLLVQYNYLENNEDIAACGAGFERFGYGSGKYMPQLLDSDEIENGFIDYNCFAVGMMRKDFLDFYQIRYKQEYIYAEDYKLWVDIVLAGGKLSNLPRVLNYYRIHEQQISTVNNMQMIENSFVIRQEIIRYLLKRDNVKYNNVVPVCDLLYDLYIRNVLTIKDYCQLVSYLMKI